jgi:hypothetical protein
MPKLADQLPNLAIVRSVKAWATGHSISQRWVQIGRNPSGALGDVAPNIGSVVSIEKYGERQSNQVLPTFIALNSGGAVGARYFPATYDPLKLTPSATGIPDTSNVDGEARMDNRYQLLHMLDDPLRINSPYGKPLDDFNDFDESAKALMYSRGVARAFNYSTGDSGRYGNMSFGNACLLATKIVDANLGTRFVQITLGGWDMHTNIYGAKGRRGLYTPGQDVRRRRLRHARGFESQRAARSDTGCHDGRIRAHGGKSHRNRGPRPLPAAVRRVRRSRCYRREGHWLD